METSLTHRPDQPLTDDALVLERVEMLVQNAIGRRLWLMFLNPDRTLGEAIMPCDDLPTDPDGIILTDGGPLSHADALSRSLAHMMPGTGFAEAIFVWERPGEAEVGSEERRWARALAESCRRRGVVVAGQFLAHDAGVRPLTPDDYLD